jgi:hypothetical protein
LHRQLPAVRSHQRLHILVMHNNPALVTQVSFLDELRCLC